MLEPKVPTLADFGKWLQEDVENSLASLPYVVARNKSEQELLDECKRLLTQLLDGAMALKRL